MQDNTTQLSQNTDQPATTDNKKVGKRVSIIFILAGLVILAIMVAILYNNKQKEAAMDSQTTATDMAVETHEDSDGDTMYSPIYSFEVNGKTYTCQSSYSSNIMPSRENSTIYYDSHDPSNCTSDYAKKGNTILLFFTLIPICFIVIGFATLIQNRKAEEKSLSPTDSVTPPQSNQNQSNDQSSNITPPILG